MTATYPTGEVVTQNYNGQGLPYSLSGSTAGNIVTATLYNSLGAITEINLGNGIKTTYEYWGIDHSTTSYGRLWEIKTQLGTEDPLQQIQYTWDPAGNLSQRYNVTAQETENFTYDWLDRLLAASGPYSDSYTYNDIGNITSRNGISYTYDSVQPHAVDAYGATSFAYDANGNMVWHGDQLYAWDTENCLTSVTQGGIIIAEFTYDGDGNRVLKTEGGQTILYINQYYEVNITTENETSYYYLGGKLVAQSVDGTISYIHQDSLSSTSLMTDSNGNQIGSTVKYLPFGGTLSGSVPTDKLFTSQRLDSTGLYYYGARYYDPGIGRFISADTMAPNPEFK
jgi:RHS repeat-associated protein